MTSEIYWKEYYSFWDKFVKDWFDQRPKDPTDEVSIEYQRCVQDLNFDELPIPYLGGHKADAVIINLNPGMSETIPYGRHKGESAEAMQCYANIDAPNEKGWLIGRFRDDFDKKYSDFIREYSCLNTKHRGREPYVCGVKWWQGINLQKVGGKRIPWLRRIYQKSDLQPERVFALELCPYHSREFQFKESTALKAFIKKHVIVPAATAVVENQLNFAVAVGKNVADILDSGVGACRKEWSYKMSDWPNDGCKRTYRLYDVSAQDGSIAQVVVTWAEHNRGIPAPGTAFVRVEKQIYDLAYDHASKNGRMVEKPSPALSILPDSRQEAELKSGVSGTHGTNKQTYNMLWCGFCNWCKKNAKSWCTMNLTPNYDSNSLDPAGRGNPHLFFRVSKDKDSYQLYLGIYSNMRKEIKRKCQTGLEQLGEVDWSYGHEGQGTTSILIPVNGDWRNPGDDLYAEMANLFERVGNTLRACGFRI